MGRRPWALIVAGMTCATGAVAQDASDDMGAGDLDELPESPVDASDTDASSEPVSAEEAGEAAGEVVEEAIDAADESLEDMDFDQEEEDLVLEAEAAAMEAMAADLEPVGEDEFIPIGVPIQETDDLASSGGQQMRHADVRIKRTVLPDYPDELQVLYGSRPVRCDADVWIDRRGVPVRVVMTKCPDGFHLNALSALAKWRWDRPTGVVPGDGLLVFARTGFVRKDKSYFPGVTYFRSPEEVTSDPELPVMLKSGKMPDYPHQVVAGDDICLVELRVDHKGKSKDLLVDGCALPFRWELQKVVKGWRWWWRHEPQRGDSRNVRAEVVFRL